MLDAVDLLLWKDDQIVGGDAGWGSSCNPHRALEIGPARPGPAQLGFHLVTHRRVNNQWAIDEEATTKFYLSRQQVEQLRTYLQDAPVGK